MKRSALRLDLARMELDGFPEDTRTFLTTLGEQIYTLQTNLVAEDKRFAYVSQTLLKDPWIKFIEDIAFAEEAVTRAAAVFDRFVELRPKRTGRKVALGIRPSHRPAT